MKVRILSSAHRQKADLRGLLFFFQNFFNPIDRDEEISGTSRQSILHKFLYFSLLNLKPHPLMIRILLLLILLPLFASGQAHTDTIQVYSPAMNKNLKAAVTMPASYRSGDQNYPVLYLLHGGAVPSVIGI